LVIGKKRITKRNKSFLQSLGRWNVISVERCRNIKSGSGLGKEKGKNICRKRFSSQSAKPSALLLRVKTGSGSLGERKERKWKQNNKKT
jgi:hypothetical protein